MIVLALARTVARPRRLVPYPGWHCGIDYDAEPLGPRLRTAIWKYCNERGMQSPIKMRFYGGLHIYSYVGNDISQCLFVGGCYEPNEFAFLDSFLERGMVFVDVGANEGLYTLFAASKVGDSGRVVALEPSEREYKRLLKNLALNGLRNVRPLRLAAASFNGTARLRVAGYRHEGHNTLGEMAYEVECSHEEEVETRLLDDILADEGIERVGAVKIDVEGAEEAVLGGMAKTIARDRPLLILEVFNRALRAQGSNAEKITELLRSRGYGLYVFCASDGRPVPLTEIGEESANVLAMPEGLAERYGLRR